MSVRENRVAGAAQDVDAVHDVEGDGVAGASVVPPTVLLKALESATPSAPLPRSAVPEASVPIKLPWMVLPRCSRRRR